MPEHKVGNLFGWEPASNTIAKPFVKWAGGKSGLLSQLENLLPQDFDMLKDVTYIEPFVGGGAMLFHMLRKHKNIKKAVINDIDVDLIRCFELIAKNPRVLIRRLREMEILYYRCSENEKNDLYYLYRDRYNGEDIDQDEKAALFIFLNHTCFNGLYRVNKNGKFNVPFGRYKYPNICNEALLMENHRLLSSVNLIIRTPGDYKLIVRNLSRRHTNFVYLDPPYRPLSVTSYFKQYSSDPFGDTQQEELKTFFDELSLRECLLMLSNSDSKDENGNSYFETLYNGYNIKKLLAPRYIGTHSDGRTKLNEVLIRNY